MSQDGFVEIDLRDARFFRMSGAFRFIGRDEAGRTNLLLEEKAGDLGARAGPSHPLWGWALTQGLCTVLIRLDPHPVGGLGRAA